MYMNDQDELCIVYPAKKNDIEFVLGKLSDQEYYNHIKSVSIPSYIHDADIAEIDSSEIPKNMYFRNAWELKNGKISINLKKCYSIKLERLKLIRIEKFNDLDKKQIIAESKRDFKEIEEILLHKQQLRDMPNVLKLEEIYDLESLEKYLPEIFIKNDLLKIV